MAINLIDIGSTANDGTGDPIRDAFTTVNNNFDFINGGLFAGTESSIVSAVSVTGGSLVSNTYIYANTYVNADSLVGNTVTSNGNLYVSQDGAYIIGNVNIIGNLNVSGSQAASQSQQSGSPILALHYSATPLVVNDGKDIGLEWQYYTSAEKRAFLGWQNASGSLVYMDDITDTANVITAGTFGNVQVGSLLISNTTAATSNTTGALKITGGVSTQGNLYVAGNVVATTTRTSNLTVSGNVVGSMYFAGADTIYIGGSPVVTSATSFNGGPVGLPTTFNDLTQSSSTSSGSVTFAGGIGIAGNVWAGNIHVNPSGNVRANVQGNIFTPAQPFITSLGTLTGLSVQGQINSRNIVPETNLTYSIGSGTSTRYSKVWAFDADLSGALTLAGELTSSSNIHINRSGVAALRTTTAVAELFNTGATTVRIGGDGVTEFDSNIQSTSTSSGAIQLKGGMSISTGNLYIGGAGGRSITATGNIVIVSGNLMPSNDGIANIGSPGSAFNTVHAVATSAKYADLAECYDSDLIYDEGTVVIFGGEKEITTTGVFADHRVAGVVSAKPAYLMNSDSGGLPIALRGRVPVRVTGPVAKGDLLVTSTTPGYATSVGADSGFGAKVFAKAIEANPGNGTKIIEAVIL